MVLGWIRPGRVGRRRISMWRGPGSRQALFPFGLRRSSSVARRAERLPSSLRVAVGPATSADPRPVGRRRPAAVGPRRTRTVAAVPGARGGGFNRGSSRPGDTGGSSGRGRWCPPSAAGRGPSGYRRSEAEDLRGPSGRSASPPWRTGTAGRSGDSRWSDDRDGLPARRQAAVLAVRGLLGAGRGSWADRQGQASADDRGPRGGGRGAQGGAAGGRFGRPRPVPPVARCE